MPFPQIMRYDDCRLTVHRCEDTFHIKAHHGTVAYSCPACDYQDGMMTAEVEALREENARLREDIEDLRAANKQLLGMWAHHVCRYAYNGCLSYR